MSNIKSIEIYVLAGGKSSRMGQDKGMILFQNKPMISHILEEVKKFELPLKIITNIDAYNVFGYEVLKDIIPEKGPMGGIYTAIQHSKSDAVLILSCDTPFLTFEVINHLLSVAGNEGITVAQTENQLHPLCAVYKVSLKNELKKRIATGQLKMQEFIASVQSKVVNMDCFIEQKSNVFANMNTPMDLAKFG